MLTWELLGAAVGAGLASGREIASFFGRYGEWGFAGIAASVMTICLLTDAQTPANWHGRWPERLWRLLSAMLLTATGGAMLAGAGEIAGAYGPWLRHAAMAVTLAVAWLLARKTEAGLAWVSRLLLAGMAVMLLTGALLPPVRSAGAAGEGGAAALARGLTYGGFNAAIMQPLLAAGAAPGKRSRRAVAAAGCLLGGLLSAGLAVLLRHRGMMETAMPFLHVAGLAGPFGRFLSEACLYLAILSTLTACLRSLHPAWLAGIVMAALLGFSGVVDAAYPVLGAGCMTMLAAMKAANFRNSSRRTFHSRRGVL